MAQGEEETEREKEVTNGLGATHFLRDEAGAEKKDKPLGGGKFRGRHGSWLLVIGSLVGST